MIDKMRLEKIAYDYAGANPWELYPVMKEPSNVKPRYNENIVDDIGAAITDKNYLKDTGRRQSRLWQDIKNFPKFMADAGSVAAHRIMTGWLEPGGKIGWSGLVTTPAHRNLLATNLLLGKDPGKSVAKYIDGVNYSNDQIRKAYNKAGVGLSNDLRNFSQKVNDHGYHTNYVDNTARIIEGLPFLYTNNLKGLSAPISRLLQLNKWNKGARLASGLGYQVAEGVGEDYLTHHAKRGFGALANLMTAPVLPGLNETKRWVNDNIDFGMPTWYKTFPEVDY